VVAIRLKVMEGKTGENGRKTVEKREKNGRKTGEKR
jgi:hypothetical protein